MKFQGLRVVHLFLGASDTPLVPRWRPQHVCGSLRPNWAVHTNITASANTHCSQPHVMFPRALANLASAF